MSTHFFRAFLFIILGTQSVFGFSSSYKQKTVVLHCGRLLDVEKKQVLAPASIVIKGKKIAKVESGYIKVSGAQIINLTGKTCSPGFIDLHVHFEQNFPKKMAFNHPDESREFLDSLGFPEKNLMAGFTTVRDLASLRNITTHFKEAIARGDIKGPRIINAGVPLSKTNGHIDPTSKIKNHKSRPHYKKDVGQYYNFIAVDSKEDVDRWFQYYFEDRPRWYESMSKEKWGKRNPYYFDAIKLAATGGVTSKNKDSHKPQMSEELIRRVVQKSKAYAKKLGRPLVVAAHAHGFYGIANAVFGGVNTVEHGTALMVDIEKVTDKSEQKKRKALRKKVVAHMKEKSTYLIPTLLAGRAILELGKKGLVPPHIVKKERVVSKGMFESFDKAVKAGVPIAFGSDTGISPHGENGREFLEMVNHSSMTPFEALRTATIHAARALQIERQIGSLEAGKVADIIALEGRPDEKIEDALKVSFVMRDGQVFKHKED